MARRPDPYTIDMFSDYAPPQLVERFAEELVRAPTLLDRIARAVAATLRDCDKPRETIAEEMTSWSGKNVTRLTLDSWASGAKANHTPSYLLLLALVHVTSDTRLLQLGAEMFGKALVDERYLSWVEVGQLADKKDEYDRAFDAARRAARKGARP